MKPATYKTKFDIYLPATNESKPRFIETIEVDAYQKFGEEFLTTESSERIEQIRARHMGLLTGQEIKVLRKKLGLTQGELSDLLQCGKKSLSRWENGRGYPSGMVNAMLRLLGEGRVSLSDLEAVSTPKSSTADEPFVHKRTSKVIHYNFRQSGNSPTDKGDLQLTLVS